GIGGMGVVYRGSDLALGRPVAVKTLRRVSPEDAMRLRREARTAAAVSHPHLAPVYGMETWQGTPILVMELLEGGTLAHRLLDRGKLSPTEMVELGISMTEALGQLHSVDILHRDIKPSNIGYTRDGTPKLMDFGIARLMYDLRREREEGERERLAEDPTHIPASSVGTHIDGITPFSKPLVGTLSYLCPEALDGKTPDALFDLWSLAIVLYECLLGRKVFSSADPVQTAVRIRMGRVPDLSQLCPEYDEGLADFFRGVLHKNKNRRPGNARELKQRLELVRIALTKAPPSPSSSA
ncbi:MAG TPA: serine/threonine-protein kinase, partial [Thermoanaerobaculia bacterium]|nr:serine/threonine-protein kinase [Thermoanaerobaculia bacterium]